MIAWRSDEAQFSGKNLRSEDTIIWFRHDILWHESNVSIAGKEGLIYMNLVTADSMKSHETNFFPIKGTLSGYVWNMRQEHWCKLLTKQLKKNYYLRCFFPNTALLRRAHDHKTWAFLNSFGRFFFVLAVVRCSSFRIWRSECAESSRICSVILGQCITI